METPRKLCLKARGATWALHTRMFTTHRECTPVSAINKAVEYEIHQHGRPGDLAKEARFCQLCLQPLYKAGPACPDIASQTQRARRRTEADRQRQRPHPYDQSITATGPATTQTPQPAEAAAQQRRTPLQPLDNHIQRYSGQDGEPQPGPHGHQTHQPQALRTNNHRQPTSTGPAGLATLAGAGYPHGPTGPTPTTDHQPTTEPPPPHGLPPPSEQQGPTAGRVPDLEQELQEAVAAATATPPPARGCATGAEQPPTQQDLPLSSFCEQFGFTNLLVQVEGSTQLYQLEQS